MKDQLRRRYERFRAEAVIAQPLSDRLSPPLLVSVTDAWEASKHRLLIVGQETLGWNFEEGSYYDWPHQAIKTFTDFLTVESAVDALIGGYSSFDFASHQPANYRSPFWRAYRQLRSTLESDRDGSVLWTNLFRASLDGGPLVGNTTPKELDTFGRATTGLLSDEISILGPRAVLFFTGPNYDRELERQMPGIRFEAFSGFEVREVALLHHELLPTCSIRTYHPKHLSLTRRLSPVMSTVAEFFQGCAIPEAV